MGLLNVGTTTRRALRSLPRLMPGPTSRVALAYKSLILTMIVQCIMVFAAVRHCRRRRRAPQRSGKAASAPSVTTEYGKVTHISNARESIPRRLRDYIISSLLSCAVVISIYSPYMLLWVGLTPNQFLLWLLGSVPMSLLVSWPIIWITMRLKKRLLT